MIGRLYLFRRRAVREGSGVEVATLRAASPLGRTVRRFFRSPAGRAGTAGLVLVCLVVVLAPVITRHSPDSINLLAENEPPSTAHWLGTDSLGRGVFTRTLYGGRASLEVGVLAVLIEMAIGTVLGGLAGFMRGAWDTIIMRLTDVVMTFPPIVIMLVVAALLGPGLRNTILVIGFLNWPVLCRLVRAKMLSVRESGFIEASRALGTARLKILVRHALPNTVDVLIVFATLGMAQAILLEAGLSFLGLGVQPPTPSWGNLISPASNLQVLQSFPWQWVPAGVAIVITVLSINFIGDGLRDALDPRSGQ